MSSFYGGDILREAQNEASEVLNLLTCDNNHHLSGNKVGYLAQVLSSELISLKAR